MGLETLSMNDDIAFIATDADSLVVSPAARSSADPAAPQYAFTKTTI